MTLPNRLWQLARRVGAAQGEEPDYVFMPIGLRLDDPAGAQPEEYENTPTNSVMFASTGGDGVHFSFLSVGDGTGAAPVVMTVPMSDDPSHVVGSDLREFLALGYWTGYFTLEQLAYDWGREKQIGCLGTQPSTEAPEEAELLGYLIAEFDLRPWPNVGQRLTELDAMYRRHIQLRPAVGTTPVRRRPQPGPSSQPGTDAAGLR